MLQVVDELPVEGRLRLLLSLSRFLFPLLLKFLPTGPLRDGLGHFYPRLCSNLPICVALHPVLPALPHLGAGVGGGASQGGIRAARISRHVGCERVVLGVCQS